MSWHILWLPRSKRDLMSVGFETAADIGSAVTRWVETAEGLAELLDGDVIRVIAPGAGCATIQLDQARGTVLVLRIYADHPLPFVVPLLDEPEDGDDD